MWVLFAVTPISALAWVTATTHAGDLAPLLGPMGAAAPFAALAVWIIKAYDRRLDAKDAQLAQVYSDVIEKVVGAIKDGTSLHRESTNMWTQVLDELRRRP